MPRPESGSDVIIYNMIDKITPSFCKYNISPNFITLVSFASKPFLYEALKSNKKNWNMIFLYIIGHAILDCLDGQTARQCNKYSEFGSKFDLFNDQLLQSFALVYILKQYKIIDFNIVNIILGYFLLNIIENVNSKTHEIQGPTSKFIHNNSIILYIIGIYIMYYTTSRNTR